MLFCGRLNWELSRLDLLNLAGLLFVLLLWVSVEEQIRHDLFFPGRAAGSDASHATDLTTQHPPHQTNRFNTLISERTRCETASNSCGSSIMSKFENCSLSHCA